MKKNTQDYEQFKKKSRCDIRFSKFRLKSPVWFTRTISISVGSVLLIIIALFFTDRSFIGWFSFFALCAGLGVLNCINWKLLQNNETCKKTWFYKIKYHFSTIITVIFGGIAVSSYVHSCGYKINSIIALSWGVLYALDLVFFQRRWTYRILPSIFLSISFFVMYSLFVSLPLGQRVILGYPEIDKAIISVFLDDNFTKLLGWGIIASILTTFVSKATEDVWYGMSRSATGDYAKVNYRFKRQRRNLLTYRGGHITRIGSLQVIFICLIMVIGVFILFGKEGNPRRLLLQLYFVGVAFAVMGFLLHQFITDDNLLRSEINYIIDRRQAAENSWGIKDAPCGSSAWEWTTFCQVITNVFCSRSPIFHENELHHGVQTLIPNPLSTKEAVCPTRLVADLIHMFEEQFELYCGQEASVEQRMIELQFAGSLMQYINRIANINSLIQWSDNAFILEVIKQMFDVYFRIIVDEFRVNGVPFEDMKKLLLFDYLKRIVNEQGEGGDENRPCRMSWWCQSQARSYYSRWEQAEAMRQLLPYEAAELLVERWKREKLVPKSSSTIESVFLDSAKHYDEEWGATENYWSDLSNDDDNLVKDRKKQMKKQFDSIAESENKERAVQCVQ